MWIGKENGLSMNLLRRTLYEKLRLIQNAHCMSTGATTHVAQSLQIEQLRERALIRIVGDEVRPFLQGLVTNDIEHLQRNSSAVYAMFLNKGGRMLCDSIIYRSQHENTFFLECDVKSVDDLVRHLKLFRVRRKIAVDSVNADYSVYVVHGGLKNAEVNEAVFPKNTAEPSVDKDIVLCQDPRLKYLGTRVVVPNKYSPHTIQKFFPDNELLPADPGNDYVSLRYKLGVGEGVGDHPPLKAFPIESNGDYLHGISFHKGCYLGQELTARTYHTGVIRKRLMPITISDPSTASDRESDIKTSKGATVGKLRGQKNGFGLALMRIEKIADSGSLTLNGSVCTVSRPFWWPGALPKTKAEAATAETQT